MNCILSAQSDIGIIKDRNQDSIFMQEIEFNGERVIFGAVCDGMGGLESGEVASATMVTALKQWLSQNFSMLVADGFEEKALYSQWKSLIVTANSKLMQYGRERGIKLGTTLIGVLIFRNKYYAVNVGDSRLYLLRDGVIQISKDQTYVQREMDLGRLTYEESLTHESRSVLLQCIGATEIIYPDYYADTVQSGDVFLLCSDGFRHVISNQEVYEQLNGTVNTDKNDFDNHILSLISLNKSRNEEDNITAGIIKVW